MMEHIPVSQIALAILTSIITGGFVLVFVEIGNRIVRENDKYSLIMKPFMHKLSAYCRCISWCEGHVVYPNNRYEKEEEFKKLLYKLRLYGSRLILSGGDFPIDYFNSDELAQLARDINNVWYWYDKMKPCRLMWKDYSDGDHYITKEIKEVNPTYISKPVNIDLLSSLSSDFYVYVYQPIEYDIMMHEVYLKHFHRQNVFIAFAVVLVLFILSLMLFDLMPIILLQLSTIVVVFMLLMGLLMLGVDMKKQIIWHNKIAKYLYIRKHLNSLYTKIISLLNRN